VQKREVRIIYPEYSSSDYWFSLVMAGINTQSERTKRSTVRAIVKKQVLPMQWLAAPLAYLHPIDVTISYETPSLYLNNFWIRTKNRSGKKLRDQLTGQHLLTHDLLTHYRLCLQ